jgi:hypothetical protein
MRNVTLHELLESQIKALDRTLSAEIASARSEAQADSRNAKEAIIKAEGAVERRLEGLNELREMVGDYQRTLMPRKEAEQRLDQIGGKVEDLEGVVERRLARSSGVATGLGWVVAAVTMVLAVVTRF